MKWLKRGGRELTRISLRVGDKTITFPVSETAANAIMNLAEDNKWLRLDNVRLQREADEIAQATAAMRDAHRREHERQERRIAAMVEEKEALRQVAANAEHAVAGLRTALANKQREVDNALTEIKRLDKQLVEARS